MKLVYDINDKPPIKKNLIYAFQQLLAIMAATLLVPILADGTGLYLNQPAALLGAGMGTLFYIFAATRKKSPVFLGSSFAFISPLAGACAYGQQAAAPRGHRPHRGPDRPEPVRQRCEQPEQYCRRQL